MRIIVGPMPCQECKRPVYWAEIIERIKRGRHKLQIEEWDIRAIVDGDGNRHACAKQEAA